MAITAKDVMELRKQTDCGMMECKKALTEADGNFEKAIEILDALVTGEAANLDVFLDDQDQVPQSLVNGLTSLGLASHQSLDISGVLLHDDLGGLLDEVDELVVLGNEVNFETTNDIDAKDEFVAYGKDIAMQVAAANPGYVDEASVPAEVVAKEKEIMLAQMAQDPKTANKPEAVKEKMIEGKIKKFFKENCLVDQEFVKDGDLTVAQYTAKVAKDLGGEIKIVKFARFVKGEGLEKRADDFASEVASMVK